MSDSYVTLTDLQARLDWDLDDAEQRIAQSALEDLSDDARAYGLDWDTVHVPRAVEVLVLRAAVRYMRNPEGYVQSRAGDETVVWSDTRKPGGAAEFTEDEIERIQTIAGTGAQGFGSGTVFGYGTTWKPRRHRHSRSASQEAYCVPTDTGAFPFYSQPSSPW